MRACNPLVAALLAAVFIATGCARNQTPMSRDEEPLADRDPYAFHRAIGMTLLQTDQPRRALPHLQRLERMRPESPEPYYLVARAFMALRLDEPARTQLQKSIAVNADYAPAHALMGVVLDAREHHVRASHSHQRAIELAPHHYGYHNNLGFNLYLRGHHDQAVEAYNRALGLEPSSRRVHNNIGFAYGELGDINRAWDHFLRGGTPAEAKNNLGMVHEGRGDLEAAFELYLEALRSDPELSQARGNLERVAAPLERTMPDDVDRPATTRGTTFQGMASHELKTGEATTEPADGGRHDGTAGTSRNELSRDENQ
jgi:Flp pilus assembly protein TadD